MESDWGEIRPFEISLPVELMEDLKEIKRRGGGTISAQVLKALCLYLNEHDTLLGQRAEERAKAAEEAKRQRMSAGARKGWARRNAVVSSLHQRFTEREELIASNPAIGTWVKAHPQPCPWNANPLWQKWTRRVNYMVRAVQAGEEPDLSPFDMEGRPQCHCSECESGIRLAVNPLSDDRQVGRKSKGGYIQI